LRMPTSFLFPFLQGPLNAGSWREPPFFFPLFSLPLFFSLFLTGPAAFRWGARRNRRRNFRSSGSPFSPFFSPSYFFNTRWCGQECGSMDLRTFFFFFFSPLFLSLLSSLSRLPSWLRGDRAQDGNRRKESRSPFFSPLHFEAQNGQQDEWWERSNWHRFPLLFSPPPLFPPFFYFTQTPPGSSLGRGLGRKIKCLSSSLPFLSFFPVGHAFGTRREGRKGRCFFFSFFFLFSFFFPFPALSNIHGQATSHSRDDASPFFSFLPEPARSTLEFALRINLPMLMRSHEGTAFFFFSSPFFLPLLHPPPPSLVFHQSVETFDPTRGRIGSPFFLSFFFLLSFPLADVRLGAMVHAKWVVRYVTTGSFFFPFLGGTARFRVDRRGGRSLFFSSLLFPLPPPHHFDTCRSAIRRTAPMRRSGERPVFPFPPPSSSSFSSLHSCCTAGNGRTNGLSEIGVLLFSLLFPSLFFFPYNSFLAALRPRKRTSPSS